MKIGRARALLWIAALLSAVAFAGCGLKKPPVPPDADTQTGAPPKDSEYLELPDDTGDRIFQLYGDQIPTPETQQPAESPEATETQTPEKDDAAEPQADESQGSP